MTAQLRDAAVAGQFYPAEPEALRATVDELLHEARARVAPSPERAPRAIIAPHAGYQYSGPIAASAYASMMSHNDPVDLVVIAGPSHLHQVHDVGVPFVDGFDMPLGAMTIDDGARRLALDVPGVVIDDHAHAQEHSIEVHLPFVAAVFGDVAVLPLAVGRSGAAALAAVLDALWDDNAVRVVISTDLSHNCPAPLARQLDRRTADAICRLEPPAHEMACGAAAVDGMLTAARNHRLVVELLDLRNSADTAGDADRVVGYGAFVLHEMPLTSS